MDPEGLSVDPEGLSVDPEGLSVDPEGLEVVTEEHLSEWTKAPLRHIVPGETNIGCDQYPFPHRA